VSLHGRSSSYDLEVGDPNAIVGLETANFFRDAVGAPRISADTTSSWSQSTSSLSFASFVKPFDRWVFSIYYQQAADFEGRSELGFTDDFFVDFYATRNQARLQLQSAGVSAAFKLGDRVAIGGSVRDSRLDMRVLQELRIDYLRDFELLFPQFFTVGEFTDVIAFRDRIDGDDQALTYNVGVLLNPNGKWSLGAVYKEGGEYEIDGEQLFFDCFSFPADLEGGPPCNPDTLQGEIVFDDTSLIRTTTRVEIPDFIGVGIAWRPTDRLIVAADANRITYSDFSPGVTEKVDDETEYHVGLEYTVLAGGGRTPVSLRAGFFTDPDHDGFRELDTDQTHYTAGAGMVIRQDLQIDVAGHFSDTVDEFVLSGVYRF
jgi:long-subunit fatty acid transport protein